MDTDHDKYMQRCLRLAAQGAGHTAPNPMVGAVLVHEDRIIGEGYHRQYGEAHAEVRCLESVAPEHRPLIPRSTLYVSLEPCTHFGRTPPCADRIIRDGIPRVVLGCLDPSEKVAGNGVERLRAAGVEVLTGVEEAAARALNRRFFCRHLRSRPYVVLKWAQSADGLIALPGPRALRLTHPYTDRVVHRWRSEEAAILIGSGTALADNPRLTTRHWPGRHPLRIVLDREGRLPASLHVLDGEAPTLVFSHSPRRPAGPAEWITLPAEEPFLPAVLSHLQQRAVLSVLVEGGARILQAFLAAGCWDEARVITTPRTLGAGLAAPVFSGREPVSTRRMAEDIIRYYHHERRNQDNGEQL